MQRPRDENTRFDTAEDYDSTHQDTDTHTQARALGILAIAFFGLIIFSPLRVLHGMGLAFSLLGTFVFLFDSLWFFWF